MRLTFTIIFKPSFSVGWGWQKTTIKLTSVDFEIEAELYKIRCSYWVSFALYFSDWWFEKVKIKLNSTQDVVEVEVRVELGNILQVVLQRMVF